MGCPTEFSLISLLPFIYLFFSKKFFSKAVERFYTIISSSSPQIQHWIYLSFLISYHLVTKGCLDKVWRTVQHVAAMATQCQRPFGLQMSLKWSVCICFKQHITQQAFWSISGLTFHLGLNKSFLLANRGRGRGGKKQSGRWTFTPSQLQSKLVEIGDAVEKTR